MVSNCLKNYGALFLTGQDAGICGQSHKGEELCCPQHSSAPHTKHLTPTKPPLAGTIDDI